MTECRELAAWAADAPSGVLPASDNFIINRLQFMQSTLPGRMIDEEAGEKRSSVYLAILRGKSRAALAHLCTEACSTCDWFPTPKQCLEILTQFREPRSERQDALMICDQFAQASLEGWIVNLEQGQPIGDVPDQWLRIGVERGALRRLADGAIVSRALYLGPYKPIGFTA